MGVLSWCHMHCTAFRSHKLSLDLLGLELVIVNRRVGTGNQARVLRKSGQCSSPPSHLSSPQVAMFFSGPFLYLMTDSQRALHILPNMISWPVIFSWINPVTFLRKNVLSLALWEKYLINAVLKIFSLAEWAGRGSGPIEAEQWWEGAPPPNPSPIEQTRLLSPRPVSVARIIYINIMQRFLQPLLWAG